MVQFQDIDELREIIEQGRMTREKYAEVRHLLVAPGVTVKDYVEMSGDFDQCFWDGNVLRLEKH